MRLGAYTPGVFHENSVTFGPCHYYRTRSGRRLIFRANQIERVETVWRVGARVKVVNGGFYQVMSTEPEQVVET